MPVNNCLGGEVAPDPGPAARFPLDNPVWHTLVGPRGALGQRMPRAARFQPEVSPFGALSDDPDAAAWADLAHLVGAGRRTVLLRPLLDVPPGWGIGHRIPCVQMTAGGVAGSDDDRFVVLGPDDVPEMLSLVAQTEPGPFGPRTIELGGYLGVRVSGRLVAMGGQRLAFPGFTEVSAVCTAQDYRGQGLGSALVLALVRHIRAGGDEPFLHAATGNESAIRLYLSLGFIVRREVEAFVVAAPSHG
jgi:ribosomal protein S18 acetylase RimI-like enzyme